MQSNKENNDQGLVHSFHGNEIPPPSQQVLVETRSTDPKRRKHKTKRSSFEHHGGRTTRDSDTHVHRHKHRHHRHHSHRHDDEEIPSGKDEHAVMDEQSDTQDSKGIARDNTRVESTYNRSYNKRGPEIFADDHVSPPLRDETTTTESEQVGTTEESTEPKGREAEEADASFNPPSEVMSGTNANEESQAVEQLHRPGAFREGGSPEDEEEETTFTVDLEGSTSGTPHHDELYMVEAQAVDEPVLVPAHQVQKWWRRPRYLMLLTGILVITVGLSAGLGLALREDSESSAEDSEPSLPGIWKQIGDDIVGETSVDGFGSSVSLSIDGDQVAVGAFWNDGNGTDSGSVSAFKWVEEVGWNQVGQSIPGAAMGDYSGWSVALSGAGDVVAIGSYGHDGPAGIDSGHVRVFESTENGWVQVGQDIDGKIAEKEFGFAVSISLDGRVVAIGGVAQARVFALEGSEWLQLGDDFKAVAVEGKFGWSISLSTHGTLVAIGAKNYDGHGGENSGQVRVFGLNGTSWTQVGEDMDGPAPYDEFGYSVALSPDGFTVASGAVHHASDSGLVRILEWTGHRWEQVGQDILGNKENDNLGFSVSLSGSGSTVAVGAPQLSRIPYPLRSDGLVENATGYVKVFGREGNNWTQIGQDIVGRRHAETCGKSVSLSADGSVVAVASPVSGHVRVYRLEEQGEDTK